MNNAPVDVFHVLEGLAKVFMRQNSSTFLIYYEPTLVNYWSCPTGVKAQKEGRWL